jgi:hypothetical protein
VRYTINADQCDALQDADRRTARHASMVVPGARVRDGKPGGFSSAEAAFYCTSSIPVTLVAMSTEISCSRPAVLAFVTYVACFMDARDEKAFYVGGR